MEDTGSMISFASSGAVVTGIIGNCIGEDIASLGGGNHIVLIKQHKLTG